MELNVNPAGLTRTQAASAFGIHVLTASGAAWAFLALGDCAMHLWGRMFLWLGLALLVDAIDGPLARRVRLPEILPRWSGETLDLVVDFVTYVFVPAYAIADSGYLPNIIALPLGALIVTTSALYFADRSMKMEGNYFKGFPAIWNVAAFYFLLIAPPPALAVLFLGGLVIMTFLPVPFIHPVRVADRRGFNMVLLVIWSALALYTMAHNMAPGTVVTSLLCAIGLYILFGGLLGRKKGIKA